MWNLSVRDDASGDVDIEFKEQPELSDIEREIEDWVHDGSWGDEGASISCRWTLFNNDEEIDDGWLTVEVEPNHSNLISEAVSPYWDGCGYDPDDHDWTAEGEGGCDENPGVWSTGGTSLVFQEHCSVCGLHRTMYVTGCQKNPGEHDTVHYEKPNEDD